MKTNKNVQMRWKYQQPPESIYFIQTEALLPTQSVGSMAFLINY